MGSGRTGWVFIGALILAAGCGGEKAGFRLGDPLVDRIVPAYAETLWVPALCLLEDGVEVRVKGLAGGSSCFHLERVDVDLEDRTYTLCPLARHLERFGYYYLDVLVRFDTTFVLRPPEHGPYWIRVVGLNDPLVDSTKVKR